MNRSFDVGVFLCAFLILMATATMGKSLGMDEPKKEDGPAKVRVLFSDKIVQPAPDVPEEANQQPRLPKQMKPASFSGLFQAKISSVTVTYSDPKVLKEKKDTEQLLNRLLTSPKNLTYQERPWAKILDIPTVAATVEHKQGKAGVWLIWGTGRSVCSAYKDEDGRWWFGLCFQNE
jgi:hypothetical protein